jgi:hypothetical protein
MSEPNISAGSEWMSVVGATRSPDFAKAFSADPVLEASVLAFACVGAEGIRIFFETARGMYDSIAFTREVRDDRQTYLEWEGVFLGEKVGGLTLLSRNAAGLIDRITLYHRPLSQVLRFSEELRRRLDGRLNGFRKT